MRAHGNLWRSTSGEISNLLSSALVCFGKIILSLIWVLSSYLTCYMRTSFGILWILFLYCSITILLTCLSFPKEIYEDNKRIPDEGELRRRMLLKRKWSMNERFVQQEMGSSYNTFYWKQRYANKKSASWTTDCKYSYNLNM